MCTPDFVGTYVFEIPTINIVCLVSGGAEKLTEGVHAPGTKPYARDVGG